MQPVDAYVQKGSRSAAVTVCITLYNYASFVVEALNSVRNQTVEQLDLVVVDDCSSDNSASVTKRWLEVNAHRFNNVLLLQQAENKGLAAARNLGFERAETPYVFNLEADNILYPRCVERLLASIEASDAAFAYCLIEKFGDETGLLGTETWSKKRLSKGNYIDAMALIRKESWAVASGYTRMSVPGWEDFELWCKFIEHGFFGVHVPEILCRYRVHGSSMLATTTNKNRQLAMLREEMQARHTWLDLFLVAEYS